MQKKVLIPNGSFSDWALTNAAHKLGLYVILSGLNENAPGNGFADEYVKADYSDREAMLALAKEKKIDYMVTNTHDFGMLSTAYVCEQMGLPGHDSLETTLDIHNKERFKPIAKRLGIHSPISEIFDNREAAAAFIRNADTKVIVKPTDNVSSRGVGVPKTPEEIETVVDSAFSMSKSKKILVEPFIEGEFATVTSFIINEEVVAFMANSSYKYPQGDVIGPEFPANGVNNGGAEPSIGFRDFAPQVIEDFNKIAKGMHLADGKFHCELKIDKEGRPWIFDVHRRMSGESVPWHEWNRTIGFDWCEWIVKAECGMDLSDFPKGLRQNKFMHYRNIYAPKNGILKRAVFDEYLTKHMLYKQPGCSNYTIFQRGIWDYRHQPLETVFFNFNDQDEMEYLADFNEDHFYDHIKFEYESFK